MTNFLKSAAIASLMVTASAPAFAAAHMDLNSMTCTDYKALSEEDQGNVAMMVIEELQTTAKGTEGGDMGNEAVGQTNTEESTDNNVESTSAANNGTQTKTEGENAENMKTQMMEKVELLNATCDRNIDATLMEAAIGDEGTK